MLPLKQPYFVLADARYLPFSAAVFDGVFSYSVIQHFSKADTVSVLSEIRRVMKSGAQSVIQMPNKAGIGAALCKRRIRNVRANGFDVRYYSIDELISMFRKAIGDSDWLVDCFLGLNIHAHDRKFVPAFYAAGNRHSRTNFRG